jgi:hypothetical protein
MIVTQRPGNAMAIFIVKLRNLEMLLGKINGQNASL